MAIWALNSRSPNLTLFCFSPLIKGSDHCSLHFVESYFFSEEGAVHKEIVHCINGFENVNFCQALEMIKTNSTYLIRKEYKSPMGSKAQIQGRAELEKWEIV